MGNDGAQTVTATYSTGGFPASITDGLNHTWSATWGGSNNADLLTATDPLFHTDTLAYSQANQPHAPTRYTDASGNHWDAVFNAFGQVLTVTPPAGSPVGPVNATYDETPGSLTLGYLKSIVDANGNKVTLDSYDSLGDLTQLSTYPITGNNNVYATTGAGYDAVQRPNYVQHPDGKTFQWFYIGEYLDHIIDEANTQYSFCYCVPCGLMTSVTGPLGWSLQWNFDGDKDLTSFVDARGKVTSYNYGPARDLQQIVYPDNTTLSFAYGNRGQPTVVTNGRGTPITIGYDGAERLTSYGSTGTGGSFVYNNDDSVQQVIDQTGTTSFTYYTNGLLASVTYNYSAIGLTNAQRLDYTYYPDGSRATMTWTNGNTVVGTWNYGYDAGGRLTSVASPWSETTTWSYDGEGKLLAQVNSNSTRVDYSYNALRGWPTQITYSRSGTTFARYNLVYDGNLNTVGNLTGVTEYDGTTIGYGYDALYRLTSENRQGTNPNAHTFQYDLAGNRTNEDGGVWSFDNANKLTSFPGYSTTHDADGDLTAISSGGQTVQSFGWNALSQLTSQTGVGGQSVTYVYDGLGRRVKCQPISQPPIYYIFDGDLLIGELQSSAPGGIKAAYTWGAAGLISERIFSGNSSRWYAFGPQGETRQLTNSSGTVVDTYVYTAYGEPGPTTGTDWNPFRYGGQWGYYTDPNVITGTILCSARWYHPTLGRWLIRDPIDYGGGPNLYQYCGGNPVGAVDPLGLMAIATECGGGGSGLGSGGSDGRDLLDNLSNLFAGWGDTLTTLPFTSISGTGLIRNWVGADSVVDRGSGYYLGGEAIGFVHLILLTRGGRPGGPTPPAQITINQANGLAAQRTLQSIVGGVMGRGFRTSLGMRFIDVYEHAAGIAHETKVGRACGLHP